MDLRHGTTAQFVVALGVLGLGVLFGSATFLLPEAPGYSQVGPGMVPAMVSIGLLVCGGVLTLEALRGGWRGMPVPEGGAVASRPLLWMVGGLVLHALLIGTAGFIVASTLLFACVARAFGSNRYLRDGLVGMLLAGSLYWLFTQVLRLSLGPAFGALAR